MKPITLSDVVNKSVQDNEFKLIYEKELLINSIAEMVFKMRNTSGLTQKELAQKAGTTQPVIARIESGKDSRVASLELLSKLAVASHMQLNINFAKVQ